MKIHELNKRNRNVICSVLFFTAAILWMIVIFLFSAQPADQSTAASHRAGELVGRIFVSGFEQWELDRQQDFASQIDFGIRKTAHAMEYALLCILISLALYFYGVPVSKCFWLSLLLTVAYAGTDEVHQLFVAGRSGQIKDVLIDSIGAVTGCGIILGIINLCNNWRNKRAQHMIL